MIINRVVLTKEGNVEATLMLSGEQAAFLMNVGLGALVQRGVVTLKDFSPEEFEQHMKEAGEAVNDVVEVATTPINPPAPAEATQQEDTTVTLKSGKTLPKDDMQQFLENVDPDLLHKA